MAERAGDEFERLGMKFQSVWGRSLQLIDCQSIKPEGFAPVAAFVESFWGGKLAALKREVEGKS